MKMVAGFKGFSFAGNWKEIHVYTFTGWNILYPRSAPIVLAVGGQIVAVPDHGLMLLIN